MWTSSCLSSRHHDVLAPTLAGHAGGPPLPGAVTASLLPDAVERDGRGGPRDGHIVGNSLGGHVALQPRARAGRVGRRARSAGG
jgi:hypothetical protein